MTYETPALGYDYDALEPYFDAQTTDDGSATLGDFVARRNGTSFGNFERRLAGAEAAATAGPPTFSGSIERGASASGGWSAAITVDEPRLAGTAYFSQAEDMVVEGDVS